jgi:hypothetical protein
MNIGECFAEIFKELRLPRKKEPEAKFAALCASLRSPNAH